MIRHTTASRRPDLGQSEESHTNFVIRLLVSCKHRFFHSQTSHVYLTKRHVSTPSFSSTKTLSGRCSCCTRPGEPLGLVMVVAEVTRLRMTLVGQYFKSALSLCTYSMRMRTIAREAADLTQLRTISRNTHLRASTGPCRLGDLKPQAASALPGA